jgi:hypothetical protein
MLMQEITITVPVIILAGAVIITAIGFGALGYYRCKGSMIKQGWRPRPEREYERNFYNDDIELGV